MPSISIGISSGTAILIIIVLSIAAVILIIKALLAMRAAGVTGCSVKTPKYLPFTVTLSAHRSSGDDIMSLTLWYERQDEICKSIEPAVAVCKELGACGEVAIELVIEKNGKYLDHDELTIELSADGRLIGVSGRENDR